MIKVLLREKVNDMTKTMKKIPAVLLAGVIAAAFAFAIGTVTTQETYAESYDLWISEMAVTSDNADDILGDETVSYDATNNILTLKDATITVTGNDRPIQSSIWGLTINVTGKNSLSGITGIETSNYTIITGEGSLQVEGTNYGIYSSNGGVLIDGPTINVTGGDGIYSIIGDVTIKDSDITATATDPGGGGISARGKVKIEGSSTVHAEGLGAAIHSATGISVGDGLGITKPENGRIEYNYDYRIVDQDGNIATSATIGPVYAITLAKTANGKATLSAEKAGEGAKVTVTATPDSGYVLDKMTYTDKDGKTTAIPSSGEITMPASDITVNVTFKKQNVKPEPTPTPAKISGTPLTTLKAGKTSMTIAWQKVTGAEGYDIFFSRCDGKGKTTAKKAQTINGNSTFAWTKSGLNAGVSYKAYVKAYVMKNGNKQYVAASPLMHAYTKGYTKRYTNAKSVKVKKTKVSIKKGKTFKIKAKVKKLKKGKKLMPTKHELKLRYLSTDTSIATVSKKGKIRGVKAGTCYVYAYAHNGVFKKIKVTVK